MTPIPFTSIAEYARLVGVEDFDEFLYCIRIMDDTIISLESKKDVKRNQKN